jgi:hypothetical protein
MVPIVATGVVYTSGKFSAQLSLIPVPNLPSVSLMPAAIMPPTGGAP